MKLTNIQRADYLARFVAAAMTKIAVPWDGEAVSIAAKVLQSFEAELAKWNEEKPITVGRNPENIDLVRYPPPPGYTVASEEDVAAAKNDAGWAFFSDGWVINTSKSTSEIHDNWTYLRPLRQGEVAR